MSRGEFITALKAELKLCGIAFSPADVLAFAADVWELAEDRPDAVWWAKRFVQAIQSQTWDGLQRGG
jgi:hypothetical protein